MKRCLLVLRETKFLFSCSACLYIAFQYCYLKSKYVCLSAEWIQLGLQVIALTKAVE
jgi:hypothetical protein